MALTESTMLPLGASAPEFSLPATDGTPMTYSDVAGTQGTVVLFICNYCPYVIHIAPALSQLAKHYMAKGIGFVAINSNDTQAYPADSFSKMAEEKALRGYDFPYLFDESQAVAKAFKAACTPDLYVFNAQNKLVYRGQFDDTRPHRIASGHYDSGKAPATGDDLKAALDVMLSGETPNTAQLPSMGCNIKWKPGNEPH